MWQFLAGFILALAAMSGPSLYNLFLGGKEQATNLVGGLTNLSLNADNLVTILTIVGVIGFIIGLVTFKGSQMLISLILIIFAPQIAAALVPIVNPPPPSPTTTTPVMTTTPVTVPQVNPCVSDPYKMCYDEIVPYLQSSPVGTYSVPAGINMPGTFTLIETDCGYNWAGQSPQSLFLSGRTDCTVKRVYIYSITPDNWFTGVVKFLNTPINYAINIKVVKPELLYERIVWEREFEMSRLSSEFGKVTLLFVMDEKMLGEIERVINPEETYKLIITHRYYSIFGNPYENVITLKVLKTSLWTSTMQTSQTTWSTTTWQSSTTTTTSTTAWWDLPRTHALYIAGPNVDPVTGVDIYLTISVLSILLNIISIMTINRHMAKRRR